MKAESSSSEGEGSNAAASAPELTADTKGDEALSQIESDEKMPKEKDEIKTEGEPVRSANITPAIASPSPALLSSDLAEQIRKRANKLLARRQRMGRRRPKLRQSLR